MLSVMKMAASMMMGGRAICRIGTVTGFQSTSSVFAAKVQLQPDEVETGWLPIMTLFGAGGWGLAAAPVVGAQAIVIFQESDPSVGIVVGMLFSLSDQPPGVLNPGEFWLTHQSGSLLKFTSDGNVTLNANAKLLATATEFDLTGNVKVSGDLTATGTVTGQTDVQAGAEPVSVVNHKHTGVQTGAGVSGPPQ